MKHGSTEPGALPTEVGGGAEEAAVPVEVLNPDGLPKPEVYRQMAVASGSRLVFLAGQVARDADGGPVGPGDLAAQTEQAYLNVATALAAAGGTFADVAKITLYVVDWSGEKYEALGEGVGRAAAARGDRRALWEPGGDA